MPYIIIITNQPGDLPESQPVAVATLDEVVAYVEQEWQDNRSPDGFEPPADRTTESGDEFWRALVTDARNLPASGGVIGPLLDGYVIDVRHVDWGELNDLADAFPDGIIPDDPRERNERIIDAYNTNH